MRKDKLFMGSVIDNFLTSAKSERELRERSRFIKNRTIYKEDSLRRDRGYEK